MTPFIEHMNPAKENAFWISAANLREDFSEFLFPLLILGTLTASILVLVGTVGMFDLAFPVWDVPWPCDWHLAPLGPTTENGTRCRHGCPFPLRR